MSTTPVDIKQVLIGNYMPYAAGTIVGRVIPAIDGLKPSNRRILYTMYDMGCLTGDKKKSSRIVGQVMKYHPHGDASIYDTMIRMATGNGSLNVPYVESKGNFGKAWSTMDYAAARYTEAKLAPICAEVFEGINENAVDMIDNFDNTEKEPALLPVKFPSVLVNTSSGIAVGKSSNIPPFNLRNVCNATIGLLDGSITNAEEMADVIGAPDFPTGGIVHVDRSELLRLITTGKGTFVTTGKVEAYSDRIIIKEIPFNADIEGIIKDVKEAMKSEMKDVASAKDLSGLQGLNGTLTLKKGTNVKSMYNKLCRLTKFRTQMTYNISVIIDNRCKTLGVTELLHEWIKFRLATIVRLYSYRLNVKRQEEFRLAIWEKLKGRLQEAAKIITDNTEEKARELLVKTFDLDVKQADILLDMKVRSLTQDRALKGLQKLEEVRATIKEYENIIASEAEQRKIIISELKEISAKYGEERRSLEAGPIVETAEAEEKEPEDDRMVTVVMTKNQNMKRLVSVRDFQDFVADPNDPEVMRVNCRNNDMLCLFTKCGTCYKVKVNDIDESKGYPKKYVYSFINNPDDTSEIIYMCAANGYKDYFHVVYNDGKGRTVYLSRVAGNRSRYKNMFEEGNLSMRNVVLEDKFFLITAKRKASYIDLTLATQLRGRSAFRVARIGNDDALFGIQPASRVPDISTIDLNKYLNGYCVKIRDDVLW